MDYLFVGGIFLFLGYIFIYIPIERYFSERKEKYLTAILQIETLQKEINNLNKKKEELTNRINSLLELNTGLRVKINSLNEQIKVSLEESERIIKSKNIDIGNLTQRVKFLEDGFSVKDKLYESLLQGDNISIAYITSLYADFLLTQYDLSSKYLENKKNPAFQEALRIQDLKKISRHYVEQHRQLNYKYEYLLHLFPELTFYVEDFESIKQLMDIKNIAELQDDFDRVQYYVTKEEFAQLSIDQRNQIALDRYINGFKTKWQIGRDFELFCGQFYENEGWEVTYFGIEKKLNDLGRDLIAIKGSTHLIIQCKYWSQEKVIHEKHIVQLYGTTIEYSMNIDIHLSVIPVFITNITLTETAKKFAEKLGVKILDNFELVPFPRIKCNINRDLNGGETRIYHLPFDQQYDRTKINKKGEFYAYTVKEAVNQGFRRAFRYFGT